MRVPFGSYLKPLEDFCCRMDDKSILAAVLFLAAALRVVRATLTEIVNADALVYLYQAKALYSGMWTSVNACTIKHVTLHPIATAFVYAATSDWILSARTVSILLGTLTIVPIYLMARLFFGMRISGLVALLYAVMHVFVSVSVDVGRDPAYWFFSAWGFYFFSAALKQERLWYLPLASIAFSLATWNRIEGALFLSVTAFYLLLKRTEGRKLLFFFAPVMLGFGALVAIQLLGTEGIYWYRFNAIPDRLTNALASYKNLRAHLALLIQHPPDGFTFQFFENVRTLLWLLGLGVVLENAAEAYFYPFLILFLVGFFDFKKWRSTQLTGYFAFQILCGFALLYIYTFNSWSMENRYLILMILPSFLFLGFGLERIFALIKQQWGMKEITPVLLFVLLILLLALPKQLHRHEQDKKVFKDIGMRIAEDNGSSAPIEILVIGSSMPWVFLYSQLEISAAICHETNHPNGVVLASLIGSRYADLLRNVDKNHIRYVVWGEKHWPSQDYDFLAEYNPVDFRIVGEWKHKDTGRIVLFKRL